MPDEQPSVQNEPSKSGGNNKTILIIVIAVLAVLLLGGGGYYFYTHRTVYVKGDDGKTVKYTSNDKNATMTDENGNTISAGEGVKIPSNFPKSIPLYPGVKYTLANVNADGTAAYSGTTSDSKDKIIAWFKAQMSAKGWTKVDIETPSGMNISNAEWVMSVTVLTDSNPASVTVSIMKKDSIPVTDADGNSMDYDQVVQQQQELLNQLNGD